LYAKVQTGFLAGFPFRPCAGSGLQGRGGVSTPVFIS
jgi:hypothetical protein